MEQVEQFGKWLQGLAPLQRDQVISRLETYLDLRERSRLSRIPVEHEVQEEVTGFTVSVLADPEGRAECAGVIVDSKLFKQAVGEPSAKLLIRLKTVEICDEKIAALTTVRNTVWPHIPRTR